MGLLSKLAGFGAQKKATDDVLLIHGLMLMSGADGVLEESEIRTIESYLVTLPEFEGKELRNLFTDARKLNAKYPTVKEAVKALAEIQSPAVRKKCFVLAMDIAMSSGDISQEEDELLEAMQRVLDIDDITAQKALEVLGWKYAV